MREIGFACMTTYPFTIKIEFTDEKAELSARLQGNDPPYYLGHEKNVLDRGDVRSGAEIPLVSSSSVISEYVTDTSVSVWPPGAGRRRRRPASGWSGLQRCGD